MGRADDRFARLPERQKEALRLYHHRLQVKEIAILMGISANTAGGYLSEAATTVGTDRRTAAAQLATYETDHPRARGRFSVGDPALSVGPPPALAGQEKPPKLTAIWSALLPLRRGAQRNELSIYQRLAPIPFIAATIAALVAILVVCLHLVGELIKR